MSVIVRCPDYTHEAKDREAAERWIARIEAAGNCRHEHTIEEPKP